MPYDETLWERIVESERAIVRLIAGLIALSMVGWLVWHFYGPKPKVEAASSRPGEVMANGAADTVAALTRLKREYREDTVGADVAGRKQWLEQRIAAKENLLRTDTSNRGGTERSELDWLESQRDDLRAEEVAEQSQEAERESQRSLKHGDEPAALAALQDALRLQREANRLRAHNSLMDVERESQLALAVSRAEAEPIDREIETFLQTADAATQPAEILNALQEAVERQRVLNRRFAGTKFDDRARLKQIEERVASIEAGRLVAKMTETERAAEAAAAAGDIPRAAAALFEASKLQRTINSQYPRSRFASSDRVKALELQRETVLAGTEVAQASAMDRDAAGLLREGAVPAALGKVHAASVLLDQVMHDHPEVALKLGQLRTRLDFIWLRRAALADLRAEVQAAARPVAGGGASRLLTIQVTQQLYSHVMNSDPSAIANPKSPVELVTWQEARDFCTRLSWMLGQVVRLPTPAEFGLVARTSGGSPAQVGQGGPVAASSASSGVSQDGAEEQLEWLDTAVQESALAPVGGGGASGTAPAGMRQKNLRRRHLGFSIMVETSGPHEIAVSR